MKTVLITGGSRGIGAATVRCFSQKGYRVFFFYEKDHIAAEQVATQTGATPICCDVSDGKQVQEAFSRIPSPDILVCNAGISISGIFQNMKEEDWDRLFQVNVKGMYHCIRQAIPGFLEKKSGAIVTVSSVWGQVGASCEAAYAATKGAVIALTKSLAQELGPSGIRVNCVAPGVIETDMCSSYTREDMQALAEQTPLGRNGTPEEVAAAICYLADAPFITGQILGINGGFAV